MLAHTRTIGYSNVLAVPTTQLHAGIDDRHAAVRVVQYVAPAAFEVPGEVSPDAVVIRLR